MTKRAAALLALAACWACAPVSLGDYLERFLWRNRLIVVFTPDPADPAYRRQTAELRDAALALTQRQVRIFEVEYLNAVRLDGEALPAMPARRFYEHFQADRRRFQLVMVGLDGSETFRSPDPVPAAALTARIDASADAR